jgi:hypothetical protein
MQFPRQVPQQATTDISLIRPWLCTRDNISYLAISLEKNQFIHR